MQSMMSQEGPDIYLIFFLLVCVVLPTSWRFLRWQLKVLRPPVNCTQKSCKLKKKKLWRRHFKHRSFLARCLFLALGWRALINYGHKVISAGKVPLDIWDPFEVLAITPLSTDAYIKKQFKRQSLKYHPDKGKDDEEKAEFQAKFIELTSAYKSLTDPGIRENYHLYGHPDGLQRPKKGIAIPVTYLRESGGDLLSCYLALVLVAVPLALASIWTQHQPAAVVTNKTGLHETTAHRFLQIALQEKDIKLSDLISLLSRSYEVINFIQSQTRGLNMQHLAQILLCLPTPGGNEQKPLDWFAELFLEAHLYNIDLPEHLTEIKDDLILIYVRLTEEFLRILQQGKHFQPIPVSIKFIEYVKRTGQNIEYSTSTSTLSAKGFQVQTANHSFCVPMEDGIYTNSLVTFEFDIILQPLGCNSGSYEVEKGEGLELDSRRVKFRDHGLHHFPHYPEYCPPKWYVFLVSSYGIWNVTLPFNLTNCPGTTSYIQKKVRMKLATSRYPTNLKLTLYIINDSGIPTYTERLSIQVCRRKDVINEMVRGELHPIIEKFFNDHKDWLNKILLQLPEAWTEVDILPHLQEKLHALETEKDESEADKMDAAAIDSKAHRLAYHLWKTAFDARHNSEGLDAWSYVVKDTLLSSSSKWVDDVSCDPETVTLS